jgi:SAM-dependent methyltransferase
LTLSRTSKRLILRALDPLDAFVRAVNGKQSQPPLHLRWDVGPLRGFEQSATEYRILLQQSAGLHEAASLLDIGCGCGQLALELRDLLGPGARYEGWDINPDAIAWCRRTLARTDPRFAFRVLDVRNRLYRPTAALEASAFVFPDTPPADIVVLKSVFTHLLKDAVHNYLRQIPRVLKPGGRCVASFFLLSPDQRRLQKQGWAAMTFHPYADGVGVANPRVPEAIVAFDEEVALAMVEDAGLRPVCPPLRGRWTGASGGISHQDILILERAHEGE